MLFYKATRFDGEVLSSEESKVWWEDIENLPILKLSPDMKDMPSVFTEDDLSECSYYQKDGEWKYELR